MTKTLCRLKFRGILYERTYYYRYRDHCRYIHGDSGMLGKIQEKRKEFMFLRLLGLCFEWLLQGRKRLIFLF